MKRLFVGNLKYEVTEAEVRALFEPFGPIREVHMPVDPETGRIRGFAFVELTDDECAHKAVAALQRKMVFGRMLHISEARPKLVGEGADAGGFRKEPRGFSVRERWGA